MQSSYLPFAEYHLLYGLDVLCWYPVDPVPGLLSGAQLKSLLIDIIIMVEGEILNTQVSSFQELAI